MNDNYVDPDYHPFYTVWVRSDGHVGASARDYRLTDQDFAPCTIDGVPMTFKILIATRDWAEARAVMQDTHARIGQDEELADRMRIPIVRCIAHSEEAALQWVIDTAHEQALAEDAGVLTSLTITAKGAQKIAQVVARNKARRVPLSAFQRRPDLDDRA